MKSPFVIKIKSTIEYTNQEISNNKILKEFEYRFSKLHCDKLKLIEDSKLIVKNELIRFPPDLNLNYWTGIGKAEINIISLNDSDLRIIEYKYWFTRFFIAFTILLAFLLTAIFTGDFIIDYKIFALKILGSIFFSLWFIWFLTIIIRHKSVYNRVIREIKNGV